MMLSSCADRRLYTARDFEDPQMKWRPVPLWFWNNATVEGDVLASELENMVGLDGYGGCAILPFGERFRPAYLSEDYFDLYGRAVAKARELGAQLSLYDEYGFPSGSMGASNGNGVPTFMNRHPGKTIKRLDKAEYALQPGWEFTLDLKTVPGTLMAVAGYNAAEKKSISLRSCIRDGVLTWTPPDGDGGWTLMVFNCVTDGDPNVDYLDPEAVRLFVEDTHEQYFKHFPEAFGRTITSTFFDEPTLYRAQGRIWTDAFNEKFMECHGFPPDSLYPALWYDIGGQTPSARNLLFGLRARLYAEGFMKTVAEWATEHGILSTGHQDQEEIQNPTSVAGDLMLDGKYMTMPGIDKIGGGRPTEDYYKVVSSSACNWDHPQVMSETFGAMGNIPVEQLYQVAIEQYSKGITNLIPHAVWYDDKGVASYFLPELSWRNPLYNKELRPFNTFLARLRYILARPGRHVADIAVLYPIQTLQAGHTLDGALGYYNGGVAVEGTDYNRISSLLTDELGRDFTYLHPEVLDDRCSVDGDGILTMHNPVNTEHFSTIILPGVKVISKSNLAKIEAAWKGGANIIFTTQLPERSADPAASDEEIQAVVRRMMDSGTAVFVASPDAGSLSDALDRSRTAADVRFETDSQPFNYIHKIIGKRHVYFFGNIDDRPSSCTIRLREDIPAACWLDPHTGTATRAALKHGDGGTEIDLTLAPSRSSFLISGKIR
ncbi:MAG: hypothetical protein IJM60_07945 [Bacteroidales bacterium]|nr:hypothetical protein [Bacteroidales bacterium]